MDFRGFQGSKVKGLAAADQNIDPGWLLFLIVSSFHRFIDVGGWLTTGSIHRFIDAGRWLLLTSVYSIPAGCHFVDSFRLVDTSMLPPRMAGWLAGWLTCWLAGEEKDESRNGNEEETPAVKEKEKTGRIHQGHLLGSRSKREPD